MSDLIKKEVILAMSGGVDSSVALHLLVKRNYLVRGVTMQNGSLSPEDLKSAEQTAKQFNIQWEVLDVEKEFQKMVINPFINAYKKGLTPNPCAICNKTIKFGFLLEVMQKKYPNSFFATGHYTRISKKEGSFFLQEAVDVKKDQSYFLGTIRPEILQRLIFPIGDYQKKEIIEIGSSHSHIINNMKESQDICFIKDNDYKTFLQERGVVGISGKIIHENGQELGVHEGIINYTIGQRRGIGIAYNERLFVKEIDQLRNTIILAPLESVYSKTLSVNQLNVFIDPEQYYKLQEEMLKCKVKSGNQKFDCTIEINTDRIKVHLKEPVFAITPGQLCVIYDNEGLIMASGIIQKKDSEEKRKDKVNA